MKYDNCLEAVFLNRPNRFVANVLINDIEETVHVKNTGRCEELLIKGCRVILTEGTGANRKTKYDLIAVYKENRGWINIDSQAPNVVVKEFLEKSNDVFPDITYLKPECPYGESRIDFYLEEDDRKILMEIKGCTLERMGMGYFPDAPTERGTKHLNELAKAVDEGYECFVGFVIQINNVTHVLPNKITDMAFRDAMVNAIKKGVKLIFFECSVTPDTLNIINYRIIDHI